MRFIKIISRKNTYWVNIYKIILIESGTFPSGEEIITIHFVNDKKLVILKSDFEELEKILILNS